MDVAETKVMDAAEIRAMDVVKTKAMEEVATEWESVEIFYHKVKKWIVQIHLNNPFFI